MFETGDVAKQFLPKDGVLFEEGDPGDAAYIVESCFKYNVRKLDDPFSLFIRDAVTVA